MSMNPQHPQNGDRRNGDGAPPAATINLDPTTSPTPDPTGPSDPGEGGGRVLVDDPRQPDPAPGRRAGQRRPILPAWLRSKAELADTARWAVGYTAHTSAYHTLRAPVYAGRLLARAPSGAGRVLGGMARWSRDAEGAPVRLAAVRREDAETYLKLSRQRDARVRLRTTLTTAAGILTLVALAVVAAAPGWAQWAALAAAVAALGVAGTPADRPLVEAAVVTTRVARLTSDRVVRALSVLGLAGITQALARDGDRAIGFPSPITRDGPGWRADIDLPPGVTVGEVADRRDKLASGLARPLGCVWPEGAPDIHPGRLILWVGDQDMSKARQPAWPLRKAATADVFAPQPFGTDQRGRWVPITLMFTSMAIGAIPRMGKTFALREVLLIGALDVRVELHAYDLKGTGDLSPLEAVAYRYRAGDDDEDIAYAIADMRQVRAELRRRAKVIRELPRDLCPENKVTPQLAGNQSLGLHPILVGVDECQVWFEHPVYGGEFEDICTDLVKRGPALGIMLVVATQRPDKDSLPTGISANVSTRYCLKVMGQTENDMVLGTSAYKSGIRATMFAWADKGIGYLRGEGADARITRTVYLDAVAAEQIAQRARAARQHAGRLAGHALGEQPDTPQGTGATLLEDILAVVADTEAKVWNETVITRLRDLRPEVYHTLVKPEQLTLALKPFGVSVGQVWATDPATGQGANRNGITRAHIAAALAQRDRPPRAG